jgi:OOP family OmpA-OmpF porin
MRTLITRTAIALTATACLSSAAWAGEKYILVSAGATTYSGTAQGDNDAALVRAGATGVQSTMGSNGTGYKFFLGYQFTPNFAVEGGYVDLGSLGYSATHATGTLSTDIKTTGYAVSAVGIAPVNNDLSFFGKAGMTIANVKGTGTGGGITVSTNEDKSSLSFGVGLTYQLTDKVGLRTELERISTDMNLFSLGLQIKY